ncbi:nucleotide-binding protein [Geothrix limicola]|uniref:Nucleotide-binding protein n=1 Tax=Geothrix limicola TaxID=2927978 RepID=A0ABQ5QCK1_9BACT|nr:RNase adapter RapZ [Geothrix limicola]GLH72564.1 nucleotide-binding protein [Geothrix limicola]
MELIVVTGLSGAGRHSVLGALEDSGCTALDNVPPRLLEPLLELESKLQPGHERLVVGMDMRQPEFVQEFGPLMERVQGSSVRVQVVFVEAAEDVLLRRFSETRRPHHLALLGTAGEGIQRERELLAPIRALATTILDTSHLSLSELRLRIAALVPQLPARNTAVRLLSFGFKRGVPADADVVLDARFLPNPFYVEALKPLTGRDWPVQEYLLESHEYREFLERAESWLRWSLPLVQQEGRAYHTLAIGCTGGQHRSVALVEMLAHRLRNDVAALTIRHRELEG